MANKRGKSNEAKALARVKKVLSHYVVLDRPQAAEAVAVTTAAMFVRLSRGRWAAKWSNESNSYLSDPLRGAIAGYSLYARRAGWGLAQIRLISSEDAEVFASWFDGESARQERESEIARAEEVLRRYKGGSAK